MGLIRRALVTLAIILLVLIVIVGGVGTWLVRRAWPKIDGTLEVEGLVAAVKVIRDEWAVPHIYAENEHDLFFAQGYVHAQDRLWQMEFNRRIGSGTLSEAVGESGLEADRFMRTLGLRRAAEKDWDLADDEVRALLQAYADGVNVYIETHQKRLPLEFMILGVKPEPWTPLDSLTWGKVMSYNLGSNFRNELHRASLIASLGIDAAQELLPPYPDGAPVIVPPEAGDYAWLRNVRLDRLAALRPVLGDASLEWGSNSWVVHGSRTDTGMPLLANDMHLGLNMPSIWYENGLHGGRIDSVGYSFPGAPLVIAGHNSRIAWGFTNLNPDVQDLYIEKLDDPDDPAQYEYLGEWQDLEIVRETIEIKGQDPEQLDVLTTRHGPIMNDVISSLEGAEPMALQWTALDGTHLFRAVQLINLAENWDDFREALSYWGAPSQNAIYADVDGNIGYQSPGNIPIRASGHQGLVPVPGWTGEYEWQGFIPFDELPNAYNPPAGFIATANNKVVSEDYPYHLAYEWAAPYRAQRITDLLAANDSISLEDIQEIHSQTYSLPAEALRPYLLALSPEDDVQRRALTEVESWDLQLEADRSGAAIYEVWYWYLVANTLGDELGDDIFNSVPLMIDLMSQADSPWFDDTATTDQLESRDQIAQRSLADAVTWLSDNYGDDPGNWEWGKLHTMVFVHQPLGQSGIGLVERLFNTRSIPARGDSFTVNAAGFSFDEPFAVTHGSSQRLIADLGDWTNSLSILTTGQSGHLFNRHREDMISLWQGVEYHPVFFDQETSTANAEAVLTLTPP